MGSSEDHPLGYIVSASVMTADASKAQTASEVLTRAALGLAMEGVAVSINIVPDYCGCDSCKEMREEEGHKGDG